MILLSRRQGSLWRSNRNTTLALFNYNNFSKPVQVPQTIKTQITDRLPTATSLIIPDDNDTNATLVEQHAEIGHVLSNEAKFILTKEVPITEQN
ncbi:unnamed protein product [Rotaria magnacalcarata]|uniref:Uncharacterized protein n=2 Tax=Rotaria magnacalcarata TaxID=392030 RepID=A0A8S2NWL1_9BILA|nr:unnamed protein product [Rotaria magnacalcarata]CAF4460128.1 unnamed protein product [Rotaria magnacalcarata]